MIPFEASAFHGYVLSNVYGPKVKTAFIFVLFLARIEHGAAGFDGLGLLDVRIAQDLHVANVVNVKAAAILKRTTPPECDIGEVVRLLVVVLVPEILIELDVHAASVLSLQLGHLDVLELGDLLHVAQVEATSLAGLESGKKLPSDLRSLGLVRSPLGQRQEVGLEIASLVHIYRVELTVELELLQVYCSVKSLGVNAFAFAGEDRVVEELGVYNLQ